MSTVSAFTAPAATTATVCVKSILGVCSESHVVQIDKPRCNYTGPAKGYTKKVGELTPEDTNWEVRASYTDALTKASVVIVQGVGVRMLAGNCPSS